MGRMTPSGFRTVLGTATAVLLAAAAAPLAAAAEIRISMDGGRVTVIATAAPLADVLAEWSRVGATRFVGAEPIGGEPVTLHLVDAAEADAIRLLLGSAAGYVAAPRRAGAAGASRYDRVTILATRRTPVVASVGRAASNPRGGVADASLPASAGAGVPAQPGGLVSMEELQRMLDAAGGTPPSTPSETREDTREEPDIPVVTTPFPGIGAEPAVPRVRWPRGRRGP